jgi:hypothetical protein
MTVQAVTADNLIADVLEIGAAATLPDLIGTPTGAFIDRCVQIDLERCIGHHNTTNVAPYHHHAPAPTNRTLPVAQVGAHRRVSRCDRNNTLNIGMPQFPGDIDTVDQHCVRSSIGCIARWLHVNIEAPHQRRNRFVVLRID